jgi:hypothetical protein
LPFNFNGEKFSLAINPESFAYLSIFISMGLSQFALKFGGVTELAGSLGMVVSLMLMSC